MTAEDAGSIYAEIRLALDGMERDAVAADKVMDDLTKKFNKKGKEGGEMYVKGFGSAQANLNKRLNNMVSSLEGVSPKMGALGSKMASAFSKPIFSMVPVVSAAFQAMLPVIGSILAAIAALIKIVSSAAKKQKEFNDNVKVAKQVADGLVVSTVKLTKEQQKQVNQYNKTVKLQKDLTAAAKSLKNTYEQTKESIKKLEPVVDGVKEKFSGLFAILDKIKSGFENIKNGVKSAKDSFVETVSKVEVIKTAFDNLMEKTQVLIDIKERLAEVIGRVGNVFASTARRLQENREADLVAQIFAEENKNILEARENLEKEKVRLNAALEFDFIEMQDYSDSLVSSGEALVEVLIQQRNIMKEKAELSGLDASEQISNIEREIRDGLKAIEVQKELSQSLKDQADIKKAAQDAEDKYNQTIEKANYERQKGLITAEELEKQIFSARSQRYSSLKAIEQKYGTAVSSNILGEIDGAAALVKADQDLVKSREDRRRLDELSLKMSEETLQVEIDAHRALAASAVTEADRNKSIQEAIKLELQLFDAQRARAKDAMMNTSEFKSASASERDAIIADFDKVTAARRKAIQEIKAEGEEESFVAKLFGSSEYGYALQIGQGVLDVYNTIAEEALETTKRYAEEQMKLIDSALKTTLDSIEKARKAELIAAGFAVEGSIESLEEQLEAARRTGDEALIYQAERRLLEQQINDKFNEQAIEAEETAAKEKAQIEYRVAQQEYRNKMINAINSGIMAALQALGSAPPPLNFVLAGLSATATGVQIAALQRNPPKPPRFENSGIVPGNSWAGDRVNALVNSGELILNRAHQDNIANQLTSSQIMRATLVLMMNSREVGREIVDLINDGHLEIKMRAVR